MYFWIAIFIKQACVIIQLKITRMILDLASVYKKTSLKLYITLNTVQNKQ